MMQRTSYLATGSSSGRRRAMVGLLVACVLVVASCSKSVSSGGDATTTSGGTDATTVAPSTAPGTTAGVELSEADLEGLLPTAEDVGADYRVAPDDTDTPDDGQDDSPFDDELEEACPALAEVSDADPDDPDAERDFTAADDRQMSVELTGDISATEVPDEAALREVVDAVNDCGEIEFSSDGIAFTARLAMELDDGFGDYGLTFTMDFTAEHPQLPAPMEFSGVMRMFAMGNTGVAVSAFGAVDSTTLETVPPDVDVVDRLAGQIEADLGELLER